jgi:hypothetical protein
VPFYHPGTTLMSPFLTRHGRVVFSSEISSHISQSRDFSETVDDLSVSFAVGVLTFQDEINIHVCS